MRLIIITSFLLINSFLLAQTRDDLSRLQGLFQPKTDEQKWSAGLTYSTNDLSNLFSGFFLLYKSFVSSQDAASCVFEPSCSVYAVQSIRYNGLIIGGMSAFDRLTRCNMLSPENYERIPNSGLLSDPIEHRH